jgi:hypothetical protein
MVFNDIVIGKSIQAYDLGCIQLYDVSAIPVFALHSVQAYGLFYASLRGNCLWP